VVTRSASASLILVLLAAMGCESHGGRVLVVIDSDYPVPAELSEVRVLAGPADDAEDRTGQAFVLTRVAPPPSGTHRLPLSLVVTPRGGDSGRHVEIEVEGRAAASGDVLIRSTRVLRGFRPGNTIVLPIFLSRNCQDRVCMDGRTCIDGDCAPIEIDPGTLRIAEEPGEEFRELIEDSGVPVDVGMDGAVDAAIDSAVDATDTGAPDTTPLDAPPDVMMDAGRCGAPVTLPYIVTEGPSTLFPMTPGPGEWAYNEPNVRRYDTYVEWTLTARPGCEIFRAEPSIPDGTPADPMVACSGTCATRASYGANYEIYRNGTAGIDEIIPADQSIAVGRIRLDLTNPAETITVMLSDWTSDFGVRRDEVYVVFHDMTFFSRPVP